MRLHLAEAPHLELHDQSPRPLALRDAALLAWLALEGPTPRDRLAAMLWPDSTEAQARTTLRQRLFQLKKVHGVDLASGSPLLQLNAALRHDLAEATELLGGQGLPDAPEMDAWLQRQRERRQKQEADELRAQAQAQEQAGDLSGALRVALALLRLQPLSEATHQRVMRLHYLLGDRAAALQAFDACERLMKDEVGARPSAQTLALLATIEQAAPPTSPGAPSTLPLAVQRPPRLVGRDADLRTLQLAWAAGQVVVISGEAGMGKSRLLEAMAPGQGAAVQVAGRPGDAGVPYATLVRLLRAVNDRLSAFAMAPEPLSQLARLLPELGEPSPSRAGNQQLALQQAVKACLHGAPGLQTLLLDDLQFADAATLEMLPALMRAPDGGALRWALAHRPTDADHALHTLRAALTDAAVLVSIELAPLDSSAVAELVDQLGLGHDPQAVAPLLLQHTGGNPLFVLETLKALWAERGAVPLEGMVQLPEVRSVRGLIDKRIGQLSTAGLALARVASIAGVDLSVALAEAVLGVGAMQLTDAWRELESAQVLRGAQFAHDLVLDAVRAAVPAAIAEHVHAQIARWLEQHQGEPARVAQHWIDAQQAVRALPWLKQAEQRARQALRNGELQVFLNRRAAIEEAAGLLDGAFETYEQSLEWHINGERSEAGYMLCDALDRLAQSPLQRIKAWMARANFNAARQDGDLGLALSQQALDEARRIGDFEWTHRAQVFLAASLYRHRRLPEALTLLEAALVWIQGHSDPVWMLEFNCMLGHVYRDLGQLTKAQAQYELTGHLARQVGDTLAQSVLLSSWAEVLWAKGRVAESVELDRQCLLLRQQFETSPASSAVTYYNMSMHGARLGLYKDSLQWSEEAERRASTASPQTLPNVLALRAQLWLRLGQVARAMDCLRRAAEYPGRSILAQAKELQVQFELGCQQGQTDANKLLQAMQCMPRERSPFLNLILTIQQAQTLPPSDAIEALRLACDDATRLEFMGQVLDTHMQRARIMLPLDIDLARGHALQALALSGEAISASGYRAELWLHCAHVLLAAGDHDRGIAVLREGVQWVRATARDQVPPEFVDGFLRRNPVNAQLLALAGRHGVSAPH